MKKRHVAKITISHEFQTGISALHKSRIPIWFLRIKPAW